MKLPFQLQEGDTDCLHAVLAADDDAFDPLQAKRLPPWSGDGMPERAELDGGKSDRMGSHPSSAKRAQHIEARIVTAR